MKTILPTFLIILTFILMVSCVDARTEITNEPDEPPIETDPVGVQTPDDPPAESPVSDDTPFTIFLDGSPVGQDNAFTVAEGSVTGIEYRSSSDADCTMFVESPEGLKLIIGQWNTSHASFVHQFQYGENTLEIHHNDDLYEFMIVAGAPDNTGNSLACDHALIDINPDAHWVFNQSAELEATSTWTQTITDLNEPSDGTAAFILRMEESEGIEERATHTTNINLICDEDNLYITTVYEWTEDVTWTTLYDPNSIYMPSRLAEGVNWARHGVMTTVADDLEYNSEITETQRCTGIETISITAGEFDAYRVEYILEINSELEEFTVEGAAWYVPGLGRILNIGEVDGNPTMELIEYNNVAPRMTASN